MAHISVLVDGHDSSQKWSLLAVIAFLIKLTQFEKTGSLGKNFVTFTFLLVESEVFLPFNKEIELNLIRNQNREKVILSLNKFKTLKIIAIYITVRAFYIRNRLFKKAHSKSLHSTKLKYCIQLNIAPIAHSDFHSIYKIDSKKNIITR